MFGKNDNIIPFEDRSSLEIGNLSFWRRWKEVLFVCIKKILYRKF